MLTHVLILILILCLCAYPCTYTDTDTMYRHGLHRAARPDGRGARQRRAAETASARRPHTLPLRRRWQRRDLGFPSLSGQIIDDAAAAAIERAHYRRFGL